MAMSAWGGPKGKKVPALIGFIALSSIGLLVSGLRGNTLIISLGRVILLLFIPFASALSRALFQIKVPPDIQAVDTVGSGDAFTAALTVALVEGQEPAAALRFACAAGAAAATRAGAQPSLPTRAEVEALLPRGADWPAWNGGWGWRRSAARLRLAAAGRTATSTC